MKDKIIIKGAGEHNLKNVDLTIPRDALVVFTGVSGSGKSSLAFDTLFAEGQRRYMESLSSYARQFLGQMEKPNVDYIEGLSPAISIEQKTSSKNPRSTVGTITEIYDYLRLLFARVGKQHCHVCGKPVGSQSVDQMIAHIYERDESTKLQILAPLVKNRKGTHVKEIDEARNEGFSRIMINGTIRDLSEEIVLDKKSKHTIDVVVDRLVLKPEIRSRLADSIETALRMSGGFIKVDYPDLQESEVLSEKNSCSDCGIGFEELSPQSFSFNSPIGMCEHCNGLGILYDFDPKKIVPDENLSLWDGAVKPWKELKDKTNNLDYQMIKGLAENLNFSLKTPWKDLPENVKNAILYGHDTNVNVVWNSKRGEYNFDSGFEGLVSAMKRRLKNTSSSYMRKYYLSFMGEEVCPHCHGKKLNPKSLAVLLEGRNIDEIVQLSVAKALDYFENLNLIGNDAKIAKEILKEIKERLTFLREVGLHYLNLNRSAPTLSGGEAQRIRLASQIGSGLVGVMYILDEPSIGLHQRDNRSLIRMLQKLKNLGNTVLVVEHDQEMMESSDQIVDFGPMAGCNGGEVVAQGNIEEIMKNPASLTGQYLSGAKSIEVPARKRKKDKRMLKVFGAEQNNLKKIDAEFPVGLFTCVTGVSGGGKSSLVNQIVYPYLTNKINRSKHPIGKFEKITGEKYFDKVISIDQSPIGRTPRSNPATYIKVFDEIRKLFASLPSAKLHGFNAGRFSFNVKGGRCEACGGNGVNQIEMHFLPDVFVPCSVCHGKRYNEQTLTVKYKEHNIADVLDLEISKALELFANIPSIRTKLQTLVDVGLDYIKLGQSSTTLSGGEAQRIKLARELSKVSTGQTLYLLDEPTTGLHFEDINKLLQVLYRLVDMGNTIVVIEHNLDVIAASDYIIDLGPDGGDGGGELVVAGTVEQVMKCENSFTGKFLKEKLKK